MFSHLTLDDLKSSLALLAFGGAFLFLGVHILQDPAAFLAWVADSTTHGSGKSRALAGLFKGFGALFGPYGTAGISFAIAAGCTWLTWLTVRPPAQVAAR